MAAKCADCGTDQVTVLPGGRVSCLVEGGDHPQLTQPDAPGEDSDLPIEAYGWQTVAEHNGELVVTDAPADDVVPA